MDWRFSSVWGMLIIVVVKFVLWRLCTKAKNDHVANLDSMTFRDPTLEVSAQDHWNIPLSKVMIWGWNCSMKLKYRRKWNDALFIWIMNEEENSLLKSKK